MILRQQYLKRLAGDLDTWAQRGLVDPANIPAILKHAQGTASPNRLTTLLAILGVVLLGFAAMSFVAANWAEMPRLTRLLILGGSMWTAIGIAIWQARRDTGPLYTDAAVLLAVILYGVAIMLIGQMYHVAGEYSGGLMLWMLGALLTAWLVPSRAALALAIILMPIWSIAALIDTPTVLHWQFIIPISLAGLLVAGMGWRFGAHLIILAWGVWFGASGAWLMGELGWPPTGVFAIWIFIALTIFAKGHINMRVIAPFEDAMIHWGLFAAMAVGFLIPMTKESGDVADSATLLLAVPLALAVLGTTGLALMQKRLSLVDAAVLMGATIILLAFPVARGVFGEGIDWLFIIGYFAATIWCISYGTRTHDRFSVNLGFVAFGLMALYVYFETIGTLLGTAAFFALGGVLLIGLSIGLQRVRKYVLAQQTTDKETSA
ncbi:DUF2157 domain-containing protein [Pyruvatibacter sp.]|uniref:DUF2157 domain-containing protein n=1 Tax=Pyruvatibacter sp. TaxID=1981328 RepID=UPI0032EAAFBA